MGHHLLYYTESFCNPSETFIYRIARCNLSYKPFVFTHKRVNKHQYPENGLTILESPHPQRTTIHNIYKVIVNSVVNGIPSKDLICKKQILKLHQHYSFSLLFSHFATCGIRLLPAARYLGLPIVTMFHGCDLSSWLRFRFYRVKLRRLFLQGDAFIVATQYMKKRSIALGCAPEKIHVIPYPVPLFFKSPGECVKQRNANFIRFIHVGRLQEKKGILYSLQAFARIHSIHPNCDFVIIGDGPQRLEAEQLCRELGIGDKVHFLGMLLFDCIKKELVKADIYVQHSVTARDGDTEGFGVSLAEASSAFLPVVATHHNGFPEVIVNEKTGFLVPERDVETMTRAMKRLVESHELRMQFGIAGHKYIARRFSSKAVGQAFASLFDEITDLKCEE